MEDTICPQSQNLSIPEMLNRITDAVISLDTNGTCLYLNPTAQSVLKVLNKNLLGKNIRDEFQHLDNQEFYHALLKAQKTQKSMFLEDFYPPFNKWYHFSIYPATTGTTIIVKEITDPKKTWNQEFDTHKKYQILFDKIPVPMWAVDVETLRFIDVNRAALEQYGYDRDEFLCLLAPQIRPVEEVENFLEHVLNTDESANNGGVWKHRKKDGTILFAEIYYHTVVLQERKVRLVLAVDVTEEILSKQKLKTSELGFKTLIENSENSIFIVDEYGDNMEVNSSACKLLGYSPSELQKMNLKDLFDDGEPDLQAWFDCFRQGTTCFSSKKIKCRDNSLVPVEINSTKLPDGRILGTVRDISEQLERTEAIRKTNERFDYILKATNDGVWELDFKTGHAWWSDNLHAILKYPPGSITINEDFFASILHPDDKARVLSGIKSALQSSQQSWSDEYRALCCDGTYGTFYDRAFILRNEIGEPEKMIGTTLDLTGIRKFENDLAESENRLRTIVQTEPECIKITDKEGFVLEMNPAGVDMLEALGPGDVIGKNILDLISEKYKSQFLLYSQQVFEGIPFQYEFEIVSFRGNYRWVESHVVPMKNAKGEITSALAITRDISAKKKAEEELIQMNEKLRLLSAHLLRVREDERTKIAREIHDELGQQMTSLKIDLSWLRRKLSKEDDLLNEKVQGMISLIDETVKSVRRISTELRPGILDDLGLIAALEWQSQEFQKRTGIKTDFSTGISEEHCDKSTATGIFRVFQESLTNIARHSGASAVRSSLLQNNGNIILAVKDNGQGIDKKTLKSSKTLGILGMQERAMMMGGSLLIESDGGTQITLTVPVEEQTERVLS